MNTAALATRRSLLLCFLGLGFRNALGQSISLPFKPIPENAPLLAQRAVSAAHDVDGIDLDYSQASLHQVDKTVLGFRAEGLSVSAVGSTLFVLGCYVGEVVVRQLGARWEMPGEHERKVGFDGMGIRTKGGAFWDPINKVFKLFRNGEEDSVWYLYMIIEKG